VSHKTNHHSGTAPEKEIGKAQNANSVCGFVWAGSIALLTCVLGWILGACHAAYMRTLPSALIVLEPPATVWFLYAVFVAAGVATLLIDFLMEIYVGVPLTHPSASSYIQNPRWVKIVAAVVVCVLGPVAVLGVRKHVRITQSGISDQRALAWREHYYPYSEVQDVALAYYWINGSKGSRGHVSSTPGVFVFLKDGTRWSPKDAELPTARSEEISAVISDHTGRQVVTPDTVVDSPAGGTESGGLIVLLGYGALLCAWFWLLRRRSRAR
jgi:hypothetical protein